MYCIGRANKKDIMTACAYLIGFHTPAHMPQFGTPCPVKAISLTNPSDVQVFSSLSVAQSHIEKQNNKRPHHTVIKRLAQKGQEGFGYKWELGVGNDNQHVNDHAQDELTDIPDTSLFTFRDCVEAIFNGGKVRVTDETPRRVSVIDIIRIVSNNKQISYAYTTWYRIRDDEHCADIYTKCSDWTFPGTAQRATPVIDATGLMLLIHILPGKRARQFRLSAAQTLVRFLTGDQSLHAELDDNAERQEALPENHPIQAIGDAVYSHPRSSKYVLHSPTMSGKRISTFYNKSVVYLLRFTFENKEYLKIGWSDEFRKRMDKHYIELPGCTIWCIYPIERACRAEKAWKHDFEAYCSPITVKGKNQTELYYGLNIQEAEERLVELWEDQKSTCTNDHEFDMMELRMKHELALKDKEIEFQRLQLQILRAQLELRQAGVN